MTKDESILDEITGEKFASDALITRFKNLAGKFGASEQNSNSEFIHKFKDSTRFYRFGLPKDYSEYFIRLDELPVYFLLESPLINNYEVYFRNRSEKKFPNEAHRSFMEFYGKWVTLKSISDKKFFANSIINIISKNINPEYFLSRIIYGIVLTYDQFFFDPFQARELFIEAEQTLEQSALDSDSKNEFRYFLKLCTGFSYLAQKDAVQASQVFSEAMLIKPAGITALYYIAYTNLLKNEIDAAADNFKKIFLYDTARLKIAVESNDLTMFHYFIKYPVSGNIFRQDDFSVLYRTIEELIEENRKRDSVSIDSLRNRLLYLSKVKFNKYYDENIIANLVFLESVVQKFHGVNNAIFNTSLQGLSEKMLSVVMQLRSNVTVKFNEEIDLKLNEFVSRIEDHQKNIAKMKTESDELKMQSKQKLDKLISTIETNAAAFIAQAEDEMNLLNTNTKLNPVNSFKNSMVYNIIATVLVFLVGGIAGYTNTEYTIGSEFNDLLSGVIFQGLKWSLITFLLGSLVSLAMAGFAFIDKSNHKHRLIQRISAIKNDKERQLNSLREKNKNREKMIQDSLKENIEFENKAISKLNRDIEILSQKLTEETNIKIAEELNPLEPLLQM